MTNTMLVQVKLVPNQLTITEGWPSTITRIRWCSSRHVVTGYHQWSEWLTKHMAALSPTMVFHIVFPPSLAQPCFDSTALASTLRNRFVCCGYRNAEVRGTSLQLLEAMDDWYPLWLPLQPTYEHQLMEATIIEAGHRLSWKPRCCRTTIPKGDCWY